MHLRTSLLPILPCLRRKKRLHRYHPQVSIPHSSMRDLLDKRYHGWTNSIRMAHHSTEGIRLQVYMSCSALNVHHMGSFHQDWNDVRQASITFRLDMDSKPSDRVPCPHPQGFQALNVRQAV